MTTRHDRRPELPLYTIRAVVELDCDDEIDNRLLWTHEESIEKRRHPCCVKWNPAGRTWVPTKNPCPVGTHEHCITSSWVVYAHTAQPWKKGPRRINKKNRPDILLRLSADGEIARQLYTADPFGKFLIEGHVTIYYNKGRFWQQVNVFSIKQVSDEQIKSQLSTIAFDRFRTVIKEAAKPVEVPRSMESKFASEIRQRRQAIARGEVREVRRASEVDESYSEDAEEP